MTIKTPRLAAALTSELDEQLRIHLTRADGQEDLAFVLWRPSTGATRTTALLADVVWPQDGDRLLHRNVSFTSSYFLRAAAAATDQGAGLALIHSHPGGVGWQRLSPEDHAAEAGHAAQVLTITGLPLLGLTYGTGDGSYSARLWTRQRPRHYEPTWAESVRIVGDKLRVIWNDSVCPRPAFRPSQVRTVSAWGPEVQANLARLHVGIVGAGSVGALVAEALARTGIARITIFDFDTVETVNLDRLLHAGERDARLRYAKVDVLARGLRHSSTARNPQITPFELSVVEPSGLAAALDCDVLFSCVDRPWARAVLNLAAYAHLVPVIDGGISVDVRKDRIRGAEWRAHMAAPGRACMECLGQYDPALVQAERKGLLDDPTYIRGLDARHQFRRNQNVFAFSAAAAAAEVLQLLTAVVAPNGVADVGAHTHHFATGTLDRETAGCGSACLYATTLLGRGDHTGFKVTGHHDAAAAARATRKADERRLRIRLGRLVDRAIDRIQL